MKDGDKKGEAYNSGRDFDGLDKFVKENLLRACDVSSGEGCSDKETKYIEKMKAKADKIPTEHDRLVGMQGKSMTDDKKAWLNQRVHILKGMKEEL